MRTLAALAVAAAALSVGLATPGASHAAPSAHATDARAKLARKRSAVKAASTRRNVPKVVAFARRQIGVPYVWGGTSRRQGGFDCSGLVYAAFRSIGRVIPRTTYAQIRVGRRVSWRGLRAGDIAFTHGGGHVVLVASRTMAISAPRRGTRIRFVPLAQIRPGFVAGRRLLAG